MKRNENLQDATRVYIRKPVIPIRLSSELVRNIQLKKLQNSSEQTYLYDTDKSNFYLNLLNFYNYNIFGYGLSGTLTNYSPYTLKGQTSIQSNFDYARDNAMDFLRNIAGTGFAYGADKLITKFVDGIFPMPSKSGSIGMLSLYAKNPIGGGAEAIVVEDTPTTVGKITSIPVEEMTLRNLIPNTVESEYIGYIKDNGVKLPTYIQRKVKVLTEETFPKYVERLDKSMLRSGFRKINDPNVQYRAYTNGQVVVDDVAPGNVGLDWLGRPKMIDFNLLTVPEWLEQGFTLKRNGGKLFNTRNKLISKNLNGSSF